MITEGFRNAMQRTACAAGVFCSTKTSRKKVGNARACGSQRRAAGVPEEIRTVLYFFRKCRRRAGGIAVRCVASRRLPESLQLAVWLSGNAMASINVVALHQTRLVPGWVTVCGRVNHPGM